MTLLVSWAHTCVWPDLAIWVSSRGPRLCACARRCALAMQCRAVGSGGVSALRRTWQPLAAWRPRVADAELRRRGLCSHHGWSDFTPIPMLEEHPTRNREPTVTV